MEGYPGYDFGISQTQVMPQGREPHDLIPQTPNQPVRQIEPNAPLKAEQTGFSERYTAYDQKLVAALNNTLKTIQDGMLEARTLDDQNYFNGRIAGFKAKLDNNFIIVHAGKRRKTKKKRSRRS